jgi:hypothetical protein
MGSILDAMTGWIIASVVLVALFVIIAYYENKGHPPENIYDYANRLDQIREDARIDKFIESELDILNNLHEKQLISYAESYNIQPVSYRVFDPYTAKYKDVDINELILVRFNELIEDKV